MNTQTAIPIEQAIDATDPTGPPAPFRNPQSAIRNQTQDWLAAAPPDGLAVIARGACWTFADLAREAAGWAGRLRALGVGPGDRVALLMGNSAVFVALVHAIQHCDAVLVPLNWRLAAPELAWQLADCGTRLLLHDAARAKAAVAATAVLPGVARYTLDRPRADSPTLAEVAPAAPTPRPPPLKGEGEFTELHFAALSEEGGLSNSPSPFRGGGRGVGAAGDSPFLRREGGRGVRSVNLDALQAIIYTSGTTGQPKGAMLTYGNAWWSAVGSALNLGTHRDDRWLVCLPLFHVGGLSILWRSVIYGVPAIIHEGFDPAAVNAAIDEEGVTVVSVVSLMLARMLDTRGGRPYPATLRAVLVGGGPVPPPLLERCAALGVPVVQTYGLTETASQAATLAPTDALRKLGAAGKPLLPTQIRIVGPDGDAAAGTVGEILVQGPTVTPGYWNRPEATAHALREGWLHTGDLGYRDAEGYLYVVDRRDDLIISGGENVYPAEVEAVLAAHPAVAEAGVVGAPDPLWGQAVRAAVVLRPGETVTAEALRAWCRARLAGYKVPATILFMDELPRNAAGKLLRRALRPVSAPALPEEASR